MKVILLASFAGLLVTGVVSTPLFSLQAATFIGPIPYLSRTNSPFYAEITNGTMFLETFESGGLSVPGVIKHGAFIRPGPDTDSVDADDGRIDGTGTNGHCLRACGPVGLVFFLFDTNILGQYPTKAGIVWTDGIPGGGVTFFAFGPEGILGTIYGGSGDNDFGGGTSEDRFFGVISSNGISGIELRGGRPCIEVDHLQYGDFDVAAGLLVSIQVADGGVDVCWYARSNVRYQLQCSTNLSTGPWTDFGVPILGSASNNCITMNARDESQRFYRVALLP